MKVAADFRRIARDTLQGKWTIAVLVGVVASLLGAIEGMGPEVKFNFDASNFNASVKMAGQTIFSTGGGFSDGIRTFMVGSFLYLMILGVILGVLYFILGSVISIGYAKFNLNLVDRVQGSFEDLFSRFSYWKTAAARILRTVYVLLWTLLLIIPGIIASYSYAMTEYILAEHPELTAGEAIKRSKEIMEGNKWRYFCLQLSFIGWQILSSLTLGIGNLWLTPYRQAATAAFYREVSGTETIVCEGEWVDAAEENYM